MGKMLMGNGDGTFTPVPISESGFFTLGDTRGIVRIVVGGESVYVVGCNNQSLKAFSPGLKGPAIKINANDQFAKITTGTGAVTKVEFYYGAGYLSQSSRTLPIYPAYQKVEITDFTGKQRSRELAEQNDILYP